ncbi:MAG: carbonic anhydrase [Parachlamydiales bacterium]|nr:carbonic anhydrase [Verrucomicrobiota bacterium]MBX3718934.1 carbonic anhydrase [Candidatus Acheromyda pituitae]
MRKLVYSSLLCFSSLCFAQDTSQQPTSDAALQRLMEGNKRFTSGQPIHKNLGLEGLSALKEGQEPFAIIVGCSDSRVPPEIVFDQGLGDIFVVRVAGNVVGPIELDSVEFAVDKLHCPLVIVLGHENCGAVKATLLGQENVPELDNIYPLIAPALKKCQAQKGDILMNAIKCNVKEGVGYLKSTPLIAKHIAANRVKIVGGYYDFDHGKVMIIPD